MVDVAAVLITEAIYPPDSAVFIMATPAKLVAGGNIRGVIGCGIASDE